MSRLFQAQRAMRRKRQAALQRGVVAILDVGTFQTSCLVLRFEENTPEGEGVGHMAGQSNFRVIGAATTRSRGVRCGEVVSMPETERAIRTAVQAAQKMAGIRVDHVIACFAGGRPGSFGLTGEVLLEDGPCAVQDVARVLASVDRPDLGPGREVLHAQPVNFGIDHRAQLRDPRGQTGEVLRADMHLLSVDDHAIENLLTCIHRCDLEIAGLASAPYAAATSALVEDEKELGAACIDMGAGTTGISVFLRRHMVYANTVRIGGDHITSDIGQGLRIPREMAEKIKCRYGGVQATGMDDREIIALEAETGDWHHDRRSATRTELIGIIRPRVEEMLEEARKCLDDAGFAHLPGQRIVLTGGASQLPGLDGLAARILGNQVRLGRPLRVQGLPAMAKGPAFAACVGLCMQGAEPQDEFWDFDLKPHQASGRTLHKAVRWFRDNW
ncbi:cell division protein FtsA [Jannaschia aquimarina]|uniref:Cell division protein FtsA n=1 Tax=Jannaschia aquimarina TaxID=935700 RepID=A0A0D1EG34_9RHOB|nr:cell division protein FtsA [Jannaschia aquimarina]KIT15831.1 Cell division protein FtsA [Jannaschia aquimarina]SNT09598.1 cell division protein FtsA [Jannaschia aquimarina]